MTAEMFRPPPLSSAVPWTVLRGREVLGHDRADLHPVQRTGRLAYPNHPIWKAGAVFVAFGTAVPDPDWARISVAAEPSRTALVAALWDRITRSVRAVTENEGETPVSAETLEYARQLLSELPQDLALPQPTVSADGELIFTWFRGLDRLDALLAPDHHLTWVFRIGGNILDGDVISFDEAGSRERFFEAVATFYE